MTADWNEGRVYFTYHPSGAIQSAIIANGKVIAQETFQQDECPRNWTDALCEMEETRKKSWSNAGTPQWGSSMEVNGEWSSDQDVFEELMNGLHRQQATPWYGSSQNTENNMLPECVPRGIENDMMDFSDVGVATPSPTSTGSSMDPTEAQHTANDPLDFFARSQMPPNPIRTNRFKKPDLEAKRMVKLSKFLEALRNHPIPSLEDHNQKVAALYDGPRLPSSEKNVSMMQFAGVLSQIGDVSTTMGFVYTLLSWEIFRREELYLVHKEKMAGNLAAKQVNQQMADLLKRRCKAKDWASDGRRAAEMVFRAMKNASFSASSCALILLGDVSSLDCMLKIAHFPVLRQRFEDSFAKFVHSESPKWEARVLKGYRMFDFEEFLRQRGRPPNRQNLPMPMSPLIPGPTGNVMNNDGSRLGLEYQTVGTNLSSSVLESDWEMSSFPWPIDTNHDGNVHGF